MGYCFNDEKGIKDNEDVDRLRLR